MRLGEKVKGYRCFACGKEHALGDAEYVCPSCGGNLDVVYDYGRIKKEFPAMVAPGNAPGIWRYEHLLPLEDGGRRPPQLIGMTPLYRADRLAGKLGVRALYVKDDGRNPSASTKDRASAVVVGHAMEREIGRVACASTGNAASSLACLAAPLDIEAVLFVPATAPKAKIAQLVAFGASVVTVDGNYDQAYDLSLAATKKYGWYSRNTGYNPFTREGKKTLAYEVAEQLVEIRREKSADSPARKSESPGSVFVPVGDGNLLSGVWKGFCDLHEMGFIDRLPRLVACQAEKSDAVKRAFESGGRLEPVSGDTVADSISVRLPRDGLAAVEAIRRSGGFAVSVSDGEILEAVRELARETGVFAEPSGAAPLAALRKAVARGLVRRDETIVLLVTGNGLKDVDSVLKSMPPPHRIKPEMGELEQLVAGWRHAWQRYT